MRSPRALRRLRRLGPLLSLLALLTLGLATCVYDYNVAHERECTGGLDDDGDGLIDCADPDCAASVQCIPETDCQNGIDDEGDGLTDCQDPDCRLDPICLGPRPCTDDGVCDTFENCFWCEDCCPQCTLGEGTDFEYIATEVVVPTTAAESSTIGVDMDNDGDIDNALGSIMGLFGEDLGTRANIEMNQRIQEGSFILLTRMGVDAFPTDHGVPFQMFPGLTDPTLDATEDNLTGQGHALIDMEADRTEYLCGALVDGTFTTGPRSFVAPIGLLGGIVYLDLERARATSPGIVTADEIPEMHLGGGMTRQTVNNQLIPFMAVQLNEAIRDNPSDSLSQIVLGYVDTNCNPSIDGCAGVVPGEGECAPWDGQSTTPPLSVTELRCNFFLNAALQPDVDVDGDGVKDLLSVGMKFRAIRVTIDN